MGTAIWLFLFLIDRTTKEDKGVGRVLGGKPIPDYEVVEALKITNRFVVARWRKTLVAGGYIRAIRTGLGYSYRVFKSKKKWAKGAENAHHDVHKPNIRCYENAHQMCTNLTSDVHKPNIRCYENAHPNRLSSDRAVDSTVTKQREREPKPLSLTSEEEKRGQVAKKICVKIARHFETHSSPYLEQKVLSQLIAGSEPKEIWAAASRVPVEKSDRMKWKTVADNLDIALIANSEDKAKESRTQALVAATLKSEQDKWQRDNADRLAEIALEESLIEESLPMEVAANA